MTLEEYRKESSKLFEQRKALDKRFIEESGWIEAYNTSIGDWVWKRIAKESHESDLIAGSISVAASYECSRRSHNLECHGYE